jgi:hypothetical protein
MDADTITFTQIFGDPSGNHEERKGARLSLTDGAWTFTPAAP